MKYSYNDLDIRGTEGSGFFTPNTSLVAENRIRVDSRGSQRRTLVIANEDLIRSFSEWDLFILGTSPSQ